MDHWFTILIVKPDAFQYRREILQLLGFNGFSVQKARTLQHMTKQHVELLSEQPNPSSKEEVLRHMTSGPTMILRLHARNPAHNPIDQLDVLLGNEDPTVAKTAHRGLEEWKHPLRAKFGTDIVRNAFYASKSWESAICDAAVFDMY